MLIDENASSMKPFSLQMKDQVSANRRTATSSNYLYNLTPTTTIWRKNERSACCWILCKVIWPWVSNLNYDVRVVTSFWSPPLPCLHKRFRKENNIKYKVFADDTMLYSVVHDPIKSASELNPDLEIINKRAHIILIPINKQTKSSFHARNTGKSSSTNF